MGNMDTHIWRKYAPRKTSPMLLRGWCGGRGVVHGRVRIMRTLADVNKFVKGEILVVEKTDPTWEGLMRQAVAVISDHGGPNSHAAIVARMLGLPTVVGCRDGTTQLKDGDIVTVWCEGGNRGRVYAGEVEFDTEEVVLNTDLRPRTRVMINIGSAEEGEKAARLPNDGVGLTRVEFVIRQAIGIHPMALVNFDRIGDFNLKTEIDRRTYGAANKADFFLGRLRESIRRIANAFFPKEVIVRFSDLKSSEYSDLLGGRIYERPEENPMLGFRGAKRYLDEQYRAAFALECEAIRQVRELDGLLNVNVIIPFCRTVAEGEEVIKEMARNGLQQHAKGLATYVMCELPSNIVMASEFAEVFDGFSIGSNDLTQLVLGVDRESEGLWEDFDERDPAVKRMIASLISKAREKERKVGICGQAPSDYPDFLQFLVEQGIHSVSLNADSVVEATIRLLRLENEVN